MCQMLEGGHPVFIARSDKFMDRDPTYAPPESKSILRFKTSDTSSADASTKHRGGRDMELAVGGGEGIISQSDQESTQAQEEECRRCDTVLCYNISSSIIGPSTTSERNYNSTYRHRPRPTGFSLRSIYKKLNPDEMPQTRKGAIQKVGVQASKNLAVEMLRTTNVLGQSRQLFQTPKDARKKHRDEKYMLAISKSSWRRRLWRNKSITIRVNAARKEIRPQRRDTQVPMHGLLRSQSHRDLDRGRRRRSREPSTGCRRQQSISARASQYSSSDDGGQDGCSTPC